MRRSPQTQPTKSPPPHVLPDAEDRIFADIIQNKTGLPEGVRRLEFRVGEDSQGDPAVWFIIIADDDLKPSKQKLDAIGRLSDALRTAVRLSNTDRFPFIEIVTE